MAATVNDLALDPLTIALLAALVVVTGAVGSITGGNSLVNVPAMMLAGMPPRVAVATNMFAVTFMTASATAKFVRAGVVPFRLTWPLAGIAAVTGVFGARLAVGLDERLVRIIIAASMIAMVAFMALRKKAETGAPPGPGRRALGFAASAALGVYGGLFSGGYTTLMTALCIAAFGLTALEAVAVTKPVNLASCAAASVVFLAGGLVDLRVGVPLAAANLVGGYLGAHVALTRGERFVRIVFLAAVGGLAVKLLVDALLPRM